MRFSLSWHSNCICNAAYMSYRYCDYLYGTIAVSAPLFLNVQPQPVASSKGGLPSPSCKGKHSKQKSSSKSKATDKAPLATDTAHLHYTVQEASTHCMCDGCDSMKCTYEKYSDADGSFTRSLICLSAALSDSRLFCLHQVYEAPCLYG